MLKNVTEISVDSIIQQAHQMRDSGYRFVTMTCVENKDDTVDLYYHFDKDYQLMNLKVVVPKGAELPSISKISFAAAFVENEIQELFGLKFEGKAIDYGGRFILSDEELDNPMLNNQIIIEQKEDK